MTVIRSPSPTGLSKKAANLLVLCRPRVEEAGLDEDRARRRAPRIEHLDLELDRHAIIVENAAYGLETDLDPGANPGRDDADRR